MLKPAFCIAWLCVVTPIGAIIASDNMPVVSDKRLKLELFAESPDIVTPTGVAVDAKGRVLCIESHTHFRPKNYEGPSADRIRMFEDTDSDGHADRVTTFFEGTQATMNLAIYHDGSVYVATRNEIFRLRDQDGNGRAEERTRIVHLETPGNYPHNGLSGFAFDFAGNVYFGFGENLGAEYKLIGSDGVTLTGGGEGGNIYSCGPDGSALRRVATGFWNPFHLCLDVYGRLFAVDNDPDSRPPCRLLHIVEGGDYGYRFRNGRKGLHPFTAWNGELPGTLPMVAGTGEAPSGILAYESDNLPEEYRGDLLVTSWGDHRIERYHLEPRGISFQSTMKPLVTGGDNFRPVGIVTAPDGSLYISDWVDRSYELHRKGRIWRLSSVDAKQPHRPTNPREAISSAHRELREAAARELLGGNSADRRVLEDLATGVEDTPVRATARSALDAHAKGTLTESGLNRDWRIALSDVDPFVRQAARRHFLKSSQLPSASEVLKLASADERLGFALVHREKGDPAAREMLPKLLRDSDPRVRFVAVQWIGEEGLKEYRENVADLLSAGSLTPDLLRACLATLELLDGRRRGDEWTGADYALGLLQDDKASATVRRLALRMLPADDPKLTTAMLQSLIGHADEALQLEAIRTVRESTRPERLQLLTRVAQDESRPVQHRAEAIVGLAGATESVAMLLSYAEGDQPALRYEALRSLRGMQLTDAQRERLERVGSLDDATRQLVERVLHPETPVRHPKIEPSAWHSLIAGDGDATAGERIFFHSHSAGCYRCHQLDGRGGRVGPDLSTLADSFTRERLIDSIVQPSKEIAPQFVPWAIRTTDGRTLTGVLVFEELDGRQVYADSEGRLHTISPAEIEERQAQKVSIMPEGLVQQLTLQEFRDLLAFLSTRRPVRP